MGGDLTGHFQVESGGSAWRIVKDCIGNMGNGTFRLRSTVAILLRLERGIGPRTAPPAGYRRVMMVERHYELLAIVTSAELVASDGVITVASASLYKCDDGITDGSSSSG